MGRKNKDAVLTENQNWGKIYSDEEDEKMIANYHTHTWRCHHASGTEREYVEAAIRGGLKILGFSDHTPQIYPDGYVNHTKMLPDQLEDYVNVILALKKEYEKDIEIHLGLEVEYYPAYFDKLLALTAQYPIEYYILGQHNLGNEIGDVMVFAPFTSDETLQRYCDQVIEAMETGCFSYVAHPDVIHYVGDPQVYEKKMYAVCEKAKELSIPLELNFLGLWDHRHYPNPDFFRMAGEVGCDVIFGSDAHQPERVWNPAALAMAQEMVKQYDLHVIETLPLRKPERVRL